MRSAEPAGSFVPVLALSPLPGGVPLAQTNPNPRGLGAVGAAAAQADLLPRSSTPVDSTSSPADTTSLRPVTRFQRGIHKPKVYTDGTV